MMTLEGYHFSENLYQGRRTLVYRGTRTRDRKPVIIKVLRNRHPNFKELVQFRNQYVITRNLEHPALIRPIALERYGNGYALVMPDDGARALWDYWQQSDRSLTEFLTIAIGLAEALHYLAGQRIIHKDIKPANILIHPETGKVLLIDFSISSLLPKEQQQPLNPNVLEGSLAYISPEQTGRMNRGIDYRTDFYSLGVTFFELLTGQLPFSTSDLMELVHCHIAQGVQFPVDSQVDEVVQGIVLKLMAKNAEDRYQSALGLKHDLEQCLQQLESTVQITPFSLGQRDISSRFIIPEKLYGREKEVQTLLNAFERVANGARSMMLVAGFSGIGKTAVVSEVHKPIVRQRGYFIKGKFDQLNRNIPFSAFVQAFRDLMGELLGSSDAELATWKAKILEAVGFQGQVLIDVIPELEGIIGKQPPAPELSGSAAQNRFNLLFGKFLCVFTTKEHPLVIFLDDLQWADSASLNLLKLLMNEPASSYLLVLGAYRDNEVFPAHPLMLALDRIVKQGAQLNRLTLATLGQPDITRLVADTLLCSPEIAVPLSRLLYQKTQGNPFFTTQFLQGLHEDGCIVFDVGAGYWQCDLAQVRQLALTDDVVEFMVGRLRKLPEVTQEVLKLAACIGNRFDVETLAVVRDRGRDEVVASLWRGLQEGLVVPESETYKFFQPGSREVKEIKEVSVGYRFLHDRIQQATNSLVPSEDRAIIHLRIAEAIRSSSGMIFDVVNHYNQANIDSLDTEKAWQVVKLNIRAGRKAQSATAFDAASDYFNMALAQIVNLDEEAWETRYELMFELHVDIIKAKIAGACWNEAEQKSKIIYEKSRDRLDRAISLQLSIEQSAQRGEFEKAIEQGRQALGLLDEEIPETDIEGKLEELIVEIRQQKKTIVELSEDRTKVLEDRRLQKILAIFSVLDAPTYLVRPDIWKFINARSVQITLAYGVAPESPAGQVHLGQILCGRLDGSYAEGFVLGQSAMAISDSYPEQKCIVCFVMGLAINHWMKPLRENINFFRLGFQAALESGIVLYAGYNLMFEPYYLHYKGQEISENLSTTEEYLRFSERTKNSLATVLLKGISIHLEGLQGQTDCGTWRDKSREFVEKVEGDNNILASAIYQITLGQIHFLLGDFEEAVGIFRDLSDRRHALLGYFSLVEQNFYSSLLRLQANTRESEQSIQIDDELRQLELWATQSPENCRHKYDLVRAENCRVVGRKMEAIDLYDRAISGAKENEYIQEEALANELAAKFYLDWGKDKIAAIYIQEAYYCYARWGAKAKTDQLCEKYPQLLTPILQQSQSPFNLSTTLNTTQSLGTATSSEDVLDFASAIKASQAISEEISLDALLSKLMQVILENAGADLGSLILNHSGTWVLAAQCLKGNTHLSTTPLDDADTLPLSIINTVKRSQQTLLINDIDQDTSFPGDTYLIQQQPKSLLCTPIGHRGQLIGILYLENNLAAGAFTSDRIEVLNLLTAQGAISIENAQLYNTLEQKVQQRTAELSDALEDLKATQKRLVESEKMAALGGLVAGVAHEINTPLGTSITVASTLAEETQSFLTVVKQGQLKRSVLNNYLDLASESTQLMLSNLARAGELIGSFKQIATDQSNLEQRRFHLKQYLCEVALSLAPQLKQTPHTLTIEGSSDITIESYPGALAQIATNLVTNSLTHGYPSGEVGQLRFDIRREEDKLQIEYADDGCGIEPENKDKIFEPFFTTARHKGGTGLGLHIVYNLVTQKLLGTIEVRSEVGVGTRFIMTLPRSVN